MRVKITMSIMAMMTTKMKLENVSKPSQVDRLAKGSGKIATMMKMRGKRSQAREILMDIWLRFRAKRMKKRRVRAAIVISICRLVIFPPYG